MAETENEAGDDRQRVEPLPRHGFAMAKGRQAFRAALWRAVPVLAAPLLLSACVPPDPPGGSVTAAMTPPPRYATYRCDADDEITLENFRTSVHVVDTRGADVELPAAPPNQTTRYGQPGYALVLEKGTALWMVSGKRPVNCRRESPPA
jgi:hypothetical protein